MSLALRATTGISGLLFVLIGLGTALQQPWATALWPFPLLETRLGFLFIGSIWVAAGASSMWFGISGNLRAAGGGALTAFVIFAGIGMNLWLKSSESPALLVWAISSLGLAVVYLAGFLTTRRFRTTDFRSMPRVVQVSFVAFALVLLASGSALVLGVPNIFPWPLAADSSALYGWIFLGNAVFFVTGLFSQRIPDMHGQLVGFLAYDLVLIVPFLGHFTTVRADLFPNLVFYVAVLVYSGALAVYYLFISPGTRVWQARAQAT